MINLRHDAWVRAVAIATAVTVVMLAVLIVSAEEIPGLKDWLKATFYHHWLGKGVLALALFIIISIVVRFTNSTRHLATYIYIEAVVALASAAIIAGYFLLHLLKLV